MRARVRDDAGQIAALVEDNAVRTGEHALAASVDGARLEHGELLVGPAGHLEVEVLVVVVAVRVLALAHLLVGLEVLEALLQGRLHVLVQVAHVGAVPRPLGRVRHLALVQDAAGLVGAGRREEAAGVQRGGEEPEEGELWMICVREGADGCDGEAGAELALNNNMVLAKGRCGGGPGLLTFSLRTLMDRMRAAVVGSHPPSGLMGVAK